MQYLYEENAGASEIRLAGDRHRYLFKVKRHRIGESIGLRNLKTPLLYSYRIEHIDKKEALLRLDGARELRIEAKRNLHIGWCQIDPRVIERFLPSINETGVKKLTFIACERSQKNFKLDFRRLEKILLNSSQQCGRSVMMRLDIAEDLAHFSRENPESWMLDFSKNRLEEHKDDIETILVGAEGGFSEEERNLIKQEKIVGLDTPLILRSESAACSIAGKILL
jgi:16S rRNA (uracil1498-N3)-methyltransferase